MYWQNFGSKFEIKNRYHNGENFFNFISLNPILIEGEGHFITFSNFLSTTVDFSQCWSAVRSVSSAEIFQEIQIGNCWKFVTYVKLMIFKVT